MKNLTLATLASLTMCLACEKAVAQFARAEGTFQSENLEVRLVLLDSENGVAATSIVLSQGACSGTVSGIGKFTSKELVFTPYVKLPGGDSCKVTVTFDAHWRKVTVIDNGACVPYHGSSCSWAGQTAVKNDRN